MEPKYDLLIKGGVAVDPASGLEARRDVALSRGKVAAVEEDLSPDQAAGCLDATGLHVLPGVIDLHVHVSSWIGGRNGHRMMALAGVTTALDMSGPVDGVIDHARDDGAGLNIACIHKVQPGSTVSGTDPDLAELKDLTADVLGQGAIGLKIIGGHYPLTPAATARAIQAAYEAGAYVAFHAGTTETGSNLDGCLEAIDLAQGRPLHLAHVNSYCRGLKKSPVLEALDALAALKAYPNICSESYLARINGTSARIVDGLPGSLVTRTCLEAGGYEPTEAGLEQAILGGWALVHLEAGGTVGLGVGPKAVAYWQDRQTDVGLSFRVNPVEARLILAGDKRDDGAFTVDCISTDGGGIPRNVIVEQGLALVRAEALSLTEFATKTSLNPARILGLTNKGFLAPGADGDLTIVDLDRLKPTTAVVAGRVIMHQGLITGSGSRFVTTPAGAAFVKDKGLEPIVVDPAVTPFLKMR